MCNDLVLLVLVAICLVVSFVFYSLGWRDGCRKTEEKIAERTYMENRRKANHR